MGVASRRAPARGESPVPERTGAYVIISLPACQPPPDVTGYGRAGSTFTRKKPLGFSLRSRGELVTVWDGPVARWNDSVSFVNAALSPSSSATS